MTLYKMHHEKITCKKKGADQHLIDSPILLLSNSKSSNLTSSCGIQPGFCSEIPKAGFFIARLKYSCSEMEYRFGIKSGICLLIAPVPVHCFSLTFTWLLYRYSAKISYSF